MFKILCVGLCVGFAENAFREAVKSYRLKVSKKPAVSAFLLVLQAFLFLTSTGFDSRTLLTQKA